MNNKNENTIIKALKKEDKKGHGLSISDMVRELPLSRGQIRISIAFLLGGAKIEEQIYGRSKVYYILK